MKQDRGIEIASICVSLLSLVLLALYSFTGPNGVQAERIIVSVIILAFFYYALRQILASNKVSLHFFLLLIYFLMALAYGFKGIRQSRIEEIELIDSQAHMAVLFAPFFLLIITAAIKFIFSALGKARGKQE